MVKEGVFLGLKWSAHCKFSLCEVKITLEFSFLPQKTLLYSPSVSAVILFAVFAAPDIIFAFGK